MSFAASTHGGPRPTPGNSSTPPTRAARKRKVTAVPLGPLLERRVLPGLNAELSVIGAGCWTIGGPASNDGVPIGWDHVDPEAAYAGLVRAYELGVTLFDTADVYGLGRSERLLGRLLRTLDRSTVLLSSKVGYFAGTAGHPYQPAQMRHQFA